MKPRLEELQQSLDKTVSGMRGQLSWAKLRACSHTFLFISIVYVFFFLLIVSIVLPRFFKGQVQCCLLFPHFFLGN